MKLRLTSASFANYTGQMGVVFFENGLSKHDVHPNDAIRIAGSIGAEWENGSPANVGDIYTQNLNTPAPSIEQQSGMSALLAVVGVTRDADQAMAMSTAVAYAQADGQDLTPLDKPETNIHAQDATDQTDAGEQADAQVEAEQSATVDKAKHTAESLAALADAEGIVGLREVAKTYDVTGNSIAVLIERILQKQD